MVQMDITMLEAEPEVDPSVIGRIFGDAGTDSFKFCITSKAARCDYVCADHPDCGPVLCRIDSIIRKTGYTLEKSLQDLPDDSTEEKVVGTAAVIGYRDGNGVLDTPRTPFPVGIDVRSAGESMIKKMLGLRDDPRRSAYIGMLKGYDIRVSLDINTLVGRHVCIMAKTGGGKSYISGDIVEELMKHDVTSMIIDPHGEYGAMRDSADKGDSRFGVEPRSYADKIAEFGMEDGLDMKALRFTLRSLDARDLVGLLQSSESKNSVLALSKAIESVKSRMEFYSLADLTSELESMDPVKHHALIRDLASLDSMHLFAERGNSLDQLVRKGMATIINLKGYPPEIQHMIVRRLGTMLFELRKMDRIPPMMLVLEEAHAFCPQNDSASSKKAVSTIASEGRKFGLGLMMVSQRPAKIDSDVLGQCGTQIILKVTHPYDVKTISSSIEGLTAGMEQDIACLPAGTAIITGVGVEHPLMVDVRPRESRHGVPGVRIIEDDEDE